MTPWLDILARLQAAGESAVVVTVVSAQGSTPREAGVKMIVTARDLHLTIGGGTLEFQAAEMARRMLVQGRREPLLHSVPLGPGIGQCCGGKVQLLFEPLPARRNTLVLFGAGHVGRAVAAVLEDLPIRLRWVDSRADQFPERPPAQAEIALTERYGDEVHAAPPGSWFLIMTHRHDLDYALTDAVLSRGDFAWLGLIGSDTKRARFESRLRACGMGEDRLARLTCPIGIPGLKGKHPREIAIAVAAQLLQTGILAAAPAPLPAELAAGAAP
ncbi:MAG TPA: xanthine dehydrogenase accessory protein XdhC [Alphaproteobacteria bacterium]|nr:xanthine dehydrogenase accessory protein XdhC [Alphaproteobacteria bacterium]